MISNPRPKSVTWLAFGVLIFLVINIIRIYMSFRIPALQISVPVWYFTITGVLWGMIGIALSLGLFFADPRAPQLTRWLSLVFLAWYWLDRILFVKTDYVRGSTPAAIGTTLLSIIIIFWVLKRPGAEIYFKETS